MSPYKEEEEESRKKERKLHADNEKAEKEGRRKAKSLLPPSLSLFRLFSAPGWRRQGEGRGPQALRFSPPPSIRKTAKEEEEEKNEIIACQAGQARMDDGDTSRSRQSRPKILYLRS